MTDIKDTLAALSEAAKDKDQPVALRLAAINKYNKVLADAYRSGQLVPVPSVETVARAIYEADDPWHIAFPWPNPDGLGMAERYREIATAVRAALAGEQ